MIQLLPTASRWHPNVESLSERAIRVFKRHVVSTAIHPHSTWIKMLVHKRHLATTTDCIYEISCANCNCSYIRETSWRFIILNEHIETQKWKPGKRIIQGNLVSSQKANNPCQLSLTMLYRIMQSTGKRQKFFAESVTPDYGLSVNLYGS